MYFILNGTCNQNSCWKRTIIPSANITNHKSNKNAFQGEQVNALLHLPFTKGAPLRFLTE